MPDVSRRVQFGRSVLTVSITHDTREEYAFRNIFISNHLGILGDLAYRCRSRAQSEKDLFRSRIFVVEIAMTVVHELQSHGTGKTLSETSSDTFRFEREHLSINTVIGTSVDSCYQPGQTWTSVFGSIGASAEEARASLISY